MVMPYRIATRLIQQILYTGKIPETTLLFIKVVWRGLVCRIDKDQCAERKERARNQSISGAMWAQEFAFHLHDLLVCHSLLVHFK